MLEVSFFEDKFLLLDIIVISCYNKFNVVYYWRNKMVIKYELIKKILNEKDCFLKMNIEYAYAILRDLKIPEDQIRNVYLELISIN